ncbi:hypothetical protein AHAS_Ahas13G0517200 [Arachis hypogaea]
MSSCLICGQELPLRNVASFVVMSSSQLERRSEGIREALSEFRNIVIDDDHDDLTLSHSGSKHTATKTKMDILLCWVLTLQHADGRTKCLSSRNNS